MNEHILAREHRLEFLDLKHRVLALEAEAQPSVILPVKLLRDTARLPKTGSEFAVGLDLYADLSEKALTEGSSTTIYPGQRMVIPTGISIAVPLGYYGRIAPRSGLAVSKGIDVLAGVIDPDYTGEVNVVILNTGEYNLSVHHGDRIAQLVVERAAQPIVRQVSELPAMKRGANGFGSTGIAA